jgi:hypothetical protein
MKSIFSASAFGQCSCGATLSSFSITLRRTEAARSFARFVPSFRRRVAITLRGTVAGLGRDATPATDARHGALVLRRRDAYRDGRRRRGADITTWSPSSAGAIERLDAEHSDSGGTILQLPWLAMWGSPYTACADGIWGNNFASAAFKDSPYLCWKARNGYDFHHRHPIGYSGFVKPFTKEHGGLLHFQFTNLRRLRAKQALYKMTEVLRWPDREPVEKVDRRYNPAVYGAGALDNLPLEWIDRYPAEMRERFDTLDRLPWQEVEVKRLWSEHGRERFAGLDLFGVVE